MACLHPHSHMGRILPRAKRTAQPVGLPRGWAEPREQKNRAAAKYGTQTINGTPRLGQFRSYDRAPIMCGELQGRSGCMTRTG